VKNRLKGGTKDVPRNKKRGIHSIFWVDVSKEGPKGRETLGGSSQKVQPFATVEQGRIPTTRQEGDKNEEFERGRPGKPL